MAERPTVLTTGANSGIGLATAIEMARRGWRSVGTVRSEEKADVLVRAASDAGVEVIPALLDVTDVEGCAEVVRRHGPKAVVNNAGFSITGAVEDVPDEEARHALETMVVAPMRLARLALPGMREQGGGRIVNVSSIYGVATTPLTGWYQGCKHAVEALSDALRAEVARSGVKVVLIEPGGFRTGIWEEFNREMERRAGSSYEPSYRRGMLGTRLAQPVMGQPSQVARVIARAVTSRAPRARYLVGYDAQAAAVATRVTPTVIKDRVSRLILGL
ncbi:MAG TPA: SDR family NAD(P)-dependent oxidoreductase [Acidimicrobiales bacterium]|nr:SDR family NAD(P)-dependent oxidoreductase [Acidimicrobiales bacterium]